MAEGFAAEFVPPGHVSSDMKPEGNNLAEMRHESNRLGVGRVSDGSTVSLMPQEQVEVAPPFAGVRPMRSVPTGNRPAAQAAATTSADPATCLRDRIGEVDMDIAQIQIGIARLAGLQVERRRLARALGVFEKH